MTPETTYKKMFVRYAATTAVTVSSQQFVEDYSGMSRMLKMLDISRTLFEIRGEEMWEILLEVAESAPAAELTILGFLVADPDFPLNKVGDAAHAALINLHRCGVASSEVAETVKNWILEGVGYEGQNGELREFSEEDTDRRGF